MALTARALLAMSAFTVAGCGAADTGPTNPPPPGGAITFGTHVQPIFTASCAFAGGCHAGPTPQQGMDLSAGRAYADIAKVPARQVPRLSRVAPGNPDSSYLVLKIEGRAGQVGGVGTRMPLGGQLTQGQIDTIRAWIAAGAVAD